MKYASKPKIIEAIEFDERRLMPDGIKVRARPVEADKPKPTEWEVYNQLHDSWIKVSRGDMLRIDLAPTDVYPIARATFDQTYEEL